MNVKKYLPLTETTYYILVALLEPGHGYYIMQKVEELSNGKVRIAAGTMYGATDNLLKQKLIQAVPSEEKRRKTYVITELGKEVLHNEAERLRFLTLIADNNNL
jgi:DNA-binding PadR family transcriptional regulator